MTEPSGDRKRKADEMEDWREITKKMTTDEQHQYMHEHDILTDCTFFVGPEDGETREFKAHRVYIARVSPVFEAMLLRGEMVEAKTGHVRVTDLSPDTFQLLLNFVYGEEPKTSSFEEAKDLMLAADKYQMKPLMEKSLSRMCEHVTPKNVWTALKFVRQLLLPSDQLLKTACIKVMQEKTVECIDAEEFVQADEEDVALLLEQDVLNVQSELKLVEAAVTWARSEAQRRGLPTTDENVQVVLEPRLLSLLRLLTLPPDWFTQTFAPSNLLTAEEKWALMNLCLLTYKESTELSKHLSASRVPRKRPTSVFYCDRIDIHINDYFINSDCDSVAKLIFNVKCDMDVKLLGFKIPSQTFEDSTKLGSSEHSYEENLLIEVQNVGRTLYANFTKVGKLCNFNFEDRVVYNSEISIWFPEPILLNSENWFQILVTFRTNGCYRRNCCKTKVVCQNFPVGVEFKFFTEEKSGYLCSEDDAFFESLIFSL